LGLLLAGCTSTNQSSTYSQYFLLVRKAFTTGLSAQRVTRQQAAAIPYASLGYRVGGGPELILILATDNAGEQLWTASNHVVLMTNGGRVVRTQGLERNMGTTTSASGDIPPPARARTGPLSYTRLVDFPDLDVYGAALNCSLSQARPETVTILGSTIATLRVNETCRAPSLDWSFTNSFWIDPQSPVVWQSVQHIHPKLDELHITIFRPPG
jgi:hypothetical protein